MISAALTLQALIHFCLGFFSPSDEDTKPEVDGEGMQANVSRGPTQDLPPQQPQPHSQKKESSVLGDLFGFEDLMKPEEPELVDQCSRSSFTSQNGRGKALGKYYLNHVQWLT